MALIYFPTVSARLTMQMWAPRSNFTHKVTSKNLVLLGRTWMGLLTGVELLTSKNLRTVSWDTTVLQVCLITLGKVRKKNALPEVFSVNTTLDSAVKFCPVRIICCPPYTRQLSISCLSTIGSSWADLWAVDKIQTWMKSTLFYQHFPNLPRTIHRSILSSLPSTDCQSSSSRVLNLGLRGKNKLTQGILFGNIQELAAAIQLCWPYSLSLKKDSLDEWAGTCPCLFPNK